MKDDILAATTTALCTAAEPRFYRTERGYHGRFYCTLQGELDRRGLLRDGAIVEMEYQKSTRHGTSQRPDIVFHIPSEPPGAAVRQNNFAVYALKRRATRRQAEEDFQKLDEMCERLDYALAIFINVDSDDTFLRSYHGRYPERFHAFGVAITNGNVLVVGE